MRFAISIFLIAAVPIAIGATLSAQSQQGQQAALQEAKRKAAQAEARSEELRQEAANAGNAADRILAQRRVLAADIDAANAEIAAAKARIAIIEKRQQHQTNSLGEASEPILRLNAALQKLTSRPATFLLAQPGSRKDYIRLRAVIDAVTPEIERRTAALRQQINIQKDLRAQQQLAVQSLTSARGDLNERRSSLAALEKANRDRAGNLTAGAALEFERAIAQGERARDIVEEIDTARLSSENAAALAELEGPLMRPRAAAIPANNQAYLLPAGATLVTGVSELNVTGYRERGLHLKLPVAAEIPAPASGRVAFAGIYRSYGQIVIIEHGKGWTTLITNFAEIAVEEGQQVAQGDILGQSGDEETEMTFELRRKGRIMDIAALLF